MMSSRFSFFAFLAMLLTTNVLHRENMSVHTTKVFEGELHYRSVENHDQAVVASSVGRAYNGARNTTYIIKGNKILFIDECTHLHTLIDTEKNQVTLYSNLINKGMQFNYESYSNTYMESFSKQGPSYMGYKNPPTLYRFQEEGKTNFMGTSVEYIKGRIENITASTDFEFYSDNRITLPVNFNKLFTCGIEISGLICRMKYTQNNQISNALPPELSKSASKKAAKFISKKTGFKISNINDLKMFVLSELKEIKERPVDDAELLVPANIKIDVSEDPNKVIELYKENHDYLVKNNMYPTQLNKDVLYAIDEEWDY